MGTIALDPVASELVTLAVAEYEATVTMAQRTLDQRLAGVKAKYAPDAVLNLQPTVDGGWALVTPDDPEEPKQAIKAPRKGRR